MSEPSHAPAVPPSSSALRVPPPVSPPPLFARNYPDDPELTRLLTFFQQGNYARVRQEAPALAARTTDLKVAAAARDLRQRLDPDPLILGLLAGAGLLLLFLTVWAYTQR